jgi:uncharacterized RDD family membrane protein YckC
LTTTFHYPSDPGSLRNAGAVSRAISFVVDLFAMGTVCLFIDGTFALAGHFFGISRFPWGDALLSMVGNGANLLVVIFYFPASWLATEGRSVGKLVFGLRVVRVDGRPLRLPTCLFREIAYWVAAIPFGLGFLAVVTGSDRRGWHDRLSRTRVVYDEP